METVNNSFSSIKPYVHFGIHDEYEKQFAILKEIYWVIIETSIKANKTLNRMSFKNFQNEMLKHFLA